MTTYRPTGSTTIFPRVNVFKTFTGRAVRRDLNGRIFGQFGDNSIDSDRYPAVEGSTCLAAESFPLDLGPLVTTNPTGVIDLRNDDCGSATIDLNPLN